MQQMPQQTTTEIRLNEQDGSRHVWEITTVPGYDGAIERCLGSITLLRATEYKLGKLAQLEEARARVAVLEAEYAAARAQEQEMEGASTSPTPPS
jgi:hypothetical protein